MSFLTAPLGRVVNFEKGVIGFSVTRRMKNNVCIRSSCIMIWLISPDFTVFLIVKQTDTALLFESVLTLDVLGK